MRAQTLAAFADGSFIFIGVLVVFFFAVVFGYYTIRGSGINEHPTSGLRDQSPGSSGPSHRSGMGRVSGDPNDSSAYGAGHGSRRRFLQSRDGLVQAPPARTATRGQAVVHATA